MLEQVHPVTGEGRVADRPHDGDADPVERQDPHRPSEEYGWLIVSAITYLVVIGALSLLPKVGARRQTGLFEDSSRWRFSWR